MFICNTSLSLGCFNRKIQSQIEIGLLLDNLMPFGCMSEIVLTRIERLVELKYYTNKY